MTISFNSIPVNLRVPGAYIEVDPSQATQGSTPMPHKVLAIGQMLDTGRATAGEAELITRSTQGASLFGRGSQLAAMLDVFKQANAFTDCYAVGITDSDAGTAATRDVTVGSEPSGAGTLYLYIGGRRMSIGVAADDAAADVASAIAQAVNDDADGFVTAAAADAVVTLTAKHAGVDAGEIDVRHSYYQGESLPPGVKLTIADPTAGTGNPDITDVLDGLGETWYTTMVVPWTDSANLRALEAELTDRWGPEKLLESHAFIAKNGTVGELSTFGTGRNSEFVTCADAGVTIVPAWLLAAADAGVDSAEPDPARPRQTLALPSSILPAGEAAQRIYTERNTLLHDGISTHTVNNGIVQIERLITMYQETATGVPDTAYLDITTLRTVAYMRYSGRAMVLRKYPRHKLAKNGHPIAPGQAIVTPNVMRGEWLALYLNDWVEAMGIADGSPAAVAQFKQDAVFEIDGGDPNRMNAIIPPDLINQLRIFAGIVQFRQ